MCDSDEDQDPTRQAIIAGLRAEAEVPEFNDAMRLLSTGDATKPKPPKLGLHPHLIELGRDGTLTRLRKQANGDEDAWRIAIIEKLNAMLADANEALVIVEERRPINEPDYPEQSIEIYLGQLGDMGVLAQLKDLHQFDRPTWRAAIIAAVITLSEVTKRL